MFDDNTMIVYGGYSQRCGDYCDDVWSFDLRDNTWMEIYPLGHFAEGKVKIEVVVEARLLSGPFMFACHLLRTRASICMHRSGS